MIFQSPHLVRRSGFTLIELMISIALVLILMIGINKVFKLTADTVSIGQAVSSAVQDSRGAQASMNDDLSSVADDAPYMLIRSTVTSAFRNRADELADRDYDVTAPLAQRQRAIYSIDLDNNNKEGEPGVPGEVVKPTDLSTRNHRTDILTFFRRGSQRRVTGNDGTYAADMSSDESVIWYGHLWLPNNAGAYIPYNPSTGDGTFPGRGTFATNPNNFYATQWPLGRMAMLLRATNPTHSAAGTIVDSFGQSQHFIGGPLISGAALKLAPLEAGTIDYSGGANTFATASRENSQPATPAPRNPPYLIHESRYDLAGWDADTFQNNLDTVAAPGDEDWWSRLMLDCRYQCDPFLLDPVTGKRGLSSATMAFSSPYFIAHCTQFAVEYAGDFIAQERAVLSSGAANPKYGQILPGNNGVPWMPDGKTKNPSYQPDGELDFVVVNGQRRIRWYGLPRDADGVNGIPGQPTANGANDLPDPVPLRDVIATAGGSYTAFKGAPFEKITGWKTPSAPTPNPTLTQRQNYADPNTGMLPTESYTSAWTAGDEYHPKLIRIIMTIDEPGGRTAEGQTYEFVFKLP
jgi:prepilin-type N-terminal cleavage/methylation domain-containing protein